MQALEKGKPAGSKEPAEPEGCNLQTRTDEEKQHIPVVHLSRGEMGMGMLTEKQKTWMSSHPNESTVENPVLLKLVIYSPFHLSCLLQIKL